jgi:hypothetical protein
MVVITYDEVKNRFANKGFTLISKNYVSKSTKMDVKCFNDHDLKLSLSSLRCNVQCKECRNAKKLEKIRREFDNIDYKLISTKYITQANKLDYECNKGHITNISYDNFKKGGKCNKCSKRPQINYEYVKQKFKEVGYELLSTEYVRAIAKLDYKCDKGHVTQISYNDLQQGTRCNKCSSSYQMTYKNSHQKLEIKCDEGHVTTIKYTHFKSSGRRCPSCSRSVGEKAVQEYLESCNYAIEYILTIKGLQSL